MSDQFAFDNEKPAHQVFLEDFAIDKAPVSNGDYSNSFAMVVTRTFAGGFQKVGRQLTANNGARRCTGSRVTANG